MKPFTIKRFIITIKVICFALSLLISTFSSAQNRLEIKDFNQSFSFSHTYTVDLETNTRSDSTSDFTFNATYSIDSNGEGTFGFENQRLKSKTLVNIKHSQIKKSNKMTYFILGGEHSARPEIIMVTISIILESNAVDRLIITNAAQKKSFVFY